MAVFLFNDLTLAQMEGVLRGVRQALRPGGRFVFTLPHPLFPFLCRQQAPFFFAPAGQAYATSQDAVMGGRIWRRDGQSVAVRCLHKTVADSVAALERSGWRELPLVEELGVSDALLQIETGQREAGQPLCAQALADLDLLDAALGSSRFRHAFLLEPGDLLVVDNHRIAHDRTAGVEGPGRPRLMLRLWLKATA